MCGICGICIAEGAGELDFDPLAPMMRALTHRGPDGEGMHVDGAVGLGHRRLSIIDLAGGTQPMYSHDRSLVLVFNGEIYNYVELKAELQGSGRRFRTSSDTEVILHLYEEKGIACVEDLNGMFAFGLWDTRNRTLLLARDRLGEKPLYYHLDEERGRLIFASELKALVEHPDVRTELSLSAVDDYLAYGYVPGDRCIIKGVSKLPPGCRLVWRRGQAKIDQYWEVTFAEKAPVDEQVVIEELERRVRAAIHLRLRSDVPLGVFLSGGVDSSAVVAFASQETSGERLKTFSVGFKDAAYDELAYARMVAERYKTDHLEIVVEDHDISVLPDLVYHLDEPFADPSALPTYYVCREARRHVTVCLSGDGGDELFAGYRRYRHALAHKQLERFTRLGLKQLSAVASGLLPRHVRGKGCLERMASSGADHYFAQCSHFAPSERLDLFHPEYGSAVCPTPRLFEPFFRDREDTSLVTVLQHADQKTYLPDDILVKVDRMSMMNSLEVRVPFLDHNVVEFANGISPDFKLRGGVGKYILKKMLSRYLPPAVLRRRKMGFGIPIKHWFRNGLASYAQDVLLARGAVNKRWLRPDAVERVISEHARGRRDLSRRIWALLVFELWCQRFGL